MQKNLVEPEEIDIKGILLKYLHYWYLFIIGIVTASMIAWIYLRYSTPQYSVSSTLLIKDDKISSDGSGNVAFNDLEIFQSSKNIQNEIQVLKSKGLMHRVLKELDLQITYYTEGDVKTSEIYGNNNPIKVITDKIDSSNLTKTLNLYIQNDNSFTLEDTENGNRSSHKFGTEIKKPWGHFTIIIRSEVKDKDKDKAKKITLKFNNLYSLAKSYNEKLNVSPVNEKASVLTISMVDAVPEKAEDIINTLIKVYNKEAVEDKNQIAANTIEFVDERLKFLTTELTTVEKNVEQYKKENELTNVSSEAQLYLEKASDYNQQLAEYEIQLDILKSIEDYLQQQGEQFELVPSTLSLQDPTLQGLIQKYNELQLSRQRMLQTTKSNNPLVKNMNDQLANLRKNILENLQNIQRSLMITLNNLQANSSRFESRIQQVPSIERQLLMISRQQSIKEKLYLYLLQKREESALSLAATISNSRVIDPAMTSSNPVKPQKKRVYLLAILVGFGLPLAFLYIRDVLNDKVLEAKDVEQATDTPILGEIAHKRSDNLLVVTQESKSPVAELFRLIRANLKFATVGKENKVILVTSSMAGEGKTFFSYNLGASLVLSGKKVVLLDFDFRKPGLTRHLGQQHKIGISNYLITNDVTMANILHSSPVLSNLYIAGSGPVPPNPAELMLLPKIGALIKALKEQFDYVIIDTAPVGKVADALSLTPHVDSSLFLIRYNFTQKDQIKIIDEIYKKRKLNHPMIVLNDARKDNTYGYGYGYGYGYDDDKKNGWEGMLGKIRKPNKA